jgi:hypothetical protein
MHPRQTIEPLDVWAAFVCLTEGGERQLTQSGVGVEKVHFPQNSPNLGDRKCLGKLRKSFVGHPDAILFLQISREGVFQQPQAITLKTPRLAGEASATRASKAQSSRELKAASFTLTAPTSMPRLILMPTIS